MTDISLTFSTPEGSREISVEGDKMSFGRGNEADYRFEDDGLSRLHATIYRDRDYIWIVDENSTNGTFVNGEKVESNGTPLNEGDAIKIGHYTTLKVKINRVKASVGENSSGAANALNQKQVSASASPSYFLPLAIIGAAFLVIVASGVFIAVTMSGGNASVVKNRDDFDTPVSFDEANEKEEKSPTPTPKEKEENVNSVVASNDNTTITDSPTVDDSDIQNVNFPGKKYLELSDADKNKYVEAKALKVARMIGNSESDSIPPAAVEKIRYWVEGYARRINTKALGGCRFGDNLQATYERASKNAPFIIHAFNERGIDPQIGLYLAMIESEHCVCLQSPTGPLGMFQFTQATGRLHGLNIRAGASPTNPDERCEPEPAARAASSYMKALTLRFGTGPLSVPLAIGSYNSGEGGLSTNLKAALDKNGSQERSFWTLIANAENLSKQFQLENVKYVPKFFAAAIVGENPKDFGLELQSLSTYSK